MMNSIFGRFALIVAVSAMSGCSDIQNLFSGDDNDDPDTDPVETFSSFDSQIVDVLDFTRLADDLDATDAEDMPTSGSVGYEGVAGFAYDAAPQSAADYQVMSDVLLEADFEDGDVTGSFDNFNTVDDEQMDGFLEVNQGEINDTIVTGDVNGVFGEGNDAVIWNLELVGEFAGDEGEYIFGTAEGTADEVGSEQATDVFGEFGVGQE